MALTEIQDSTYKLKFEDENLTDEYMFLIAMSPLQLSDQQHSTKKLWSNPRSSFLVKIFL